MVTPTVQGHAALAASALMAAWLANSAPAAAGDVYVLSAPAMQPVLEEIVGDFERISGHPVVIRYATMGAFTRTLPDERADLVISSRQYISELARQGRIRAQLTICRIVGKAGAAFAGPQPNELQDHTVVSAGIHKDAPESEAVSALMAFLASAKAVAVMKAKGMDVD